MLCHTFKTNSEISSFPKFFRDLITPRTNKFLIKWKGILWNFLKINTRQSSLKSVSKKLQLTCNSKSLQNCVLIQISLKLSRVNLETTFCKKVLKNFVRLMNKKSFCSKPSSKVLAMSTSTRFNKNGAMNFWKVTLILWYAKIKPMRSKEICLKIYFMNKWIKLTPKINSSSIIMALQDTAKALAVVVISAVTVSNTRRNTFHTKTNSTTKRKRKTALKHPIRKWSQCN